MKRTQSQAQNIRDYFTKNPGKTVSEVAKVMGVKYQTVYMTKRAMDKKLSDPKKPKNWRMVHMATSANSIEKAVMVDLTQHADGSITEKVTHMPVTMLEPKSDPVNHPAHYKVGGIETIDFIEAKRFNYNMGNAVKYIARADYKGNRKQDLEKAIWYLQREIGQTKNDTSTKNV